MTSPFDAFDTLLCGAMADRFGEVAVHRPRVLEQYAERRADQDRHAQAMTGIFSAGPADTRLKGSARSGDFSGTTRLAGLSAEFWIAADMVAALADRPRKGDTLVLTARAGQPVYAITMVAPSDMGDLNLILVREDQPQ
ncbi:hypothetical protein [Oricola sp.]|uniref:hypothetical protein n=1 Tax=Oricola sp. TaxID=1979950 RepID=UPI0025D74065|nr:hypothetical protein [Oricola sp.]MCI5078717.1 hypothetical protein [Oricola sp.]